jgi:hypothetical protein
LRAYDDEKKIQLTAVYLPLEVLVRELGAKLALALALLSRGIPVLIGSSGLSIRIFRGFQPALYYS